MVFAAFDEEELGLYGSKGYSDTAYLHGDSIVGVINLDMISYDGNNDSKSYIVTNTNSSPFADEVISALNTYVPTLNPIKYFDNTANSDHASFWTHNWKAILSIEDENDFTPYYHTVNDKFNTLNVPFFQKMTKGAIAALAALAADYKMTFVHTPIQSGPSTGIRTAIAVISSKKKVAKLSNAPRLYYKINNGAFTFTNAFYNNLDTFKFNIPGQPTGTTVSYYLAAQDSLGQFVCTYPAGGKGISPPGTTAPINLFIYQVESLATACIGTGTATVSYPFNTYWHDSKTDMLYTASEVIANGGDVGNIMKIGYNISTIAPLVMNGFTIKMQNSSLNTLTGFEQNDWSVVYTGTYSVTTTGIQYIDLQTPFYWNGINNLLIEICFDNTSYTTSSTYIYRRFDAKQQTESMPENELTA
ncbi:MAG: M28 family peptidase [Ignavibacteriae bacterium]|nr:M28 family peptidase [Ignavibacteriota bacterium]